MSPPIKLGPTDRQQQQLLTVACPIWQGSLALCMGCCSWATCQTSSRQNALLQLTRRWQGLRVQPNLGRAKHPLWVAGLYRPFPLPMERGHIRVPLTVAQSPNNNLLPTDSTGPAASATSWLLSFIGFASELLLCMCLCLCWTKMVRCPTEPIWKKYKPSQLQQPANQVNAFVP